jgi:hypothetical protein
MAGPCDSPKLVTAKRFPKVLPLIIVHSKIAARLSSGHCVEKKTRQPEVYSSAGTPIPRSGKDRTQ